MTPEQAAQLREQFPPEMIGKLPRVTCRDCAANKTQRHCQKHNLSKCAECGNYMTTAHIHLDFVGHAATTDRLLKVDPEWTWRPLATEVDTGFPKFDSEGGMWILLTVAGVTRPGYGDGANPKEVISDAIRNAAMRFGVALDLWAKEPLTTDGADAVGQKSPRRVSSSPARAATPAIPPEKPATPDADESSRSSQPKHGSAGVTPTPASGVTETTGDEHVLSTADLKLPPSARRVVTKPQIKKMWAMAHGYRLSDDQVREIMLRTAGVDHSDEIQRQHLDAVLREIELTGRGMTA